MKIFSVTFALTLLAGLTWQGLWLTPDQQGQLLFSNGDYVDAAQAFEDPRWQAAAWYRAGEFKKAAQAFARRDDSDDFFNQGNAWLMQGNYSEAIRCYDRALELHSGWIEAIENRDLAEARAKALDFEAGNMTDGKLGADEIVFDPKAQRSDQENTETVVASDQLSAAEMQALWLRRVQTRPADFLRSKFAFQAAEQESIKSANKVKTDLEEQP